jgi:hypothetical protein
MAKFLVFGGIMFLAATLIGQPPPKDPSFVYLGHLYGESNSGNYQQNQEVLLPAGFQLDKSYHQSTVNCCGGGATSNMQASQIPAGIHISIDGGHYWSVPSAPVLAPAKISDDDRILQWKLIVPMYCGPNPPVGCNIKVDVWAKKQP